MDALTSPTTRNEVPEWSGEFWVQEEFGYLQIHVDDHRPHRPPEQGWAFVMVYAVPEDNCFVFCYRAVSSLTIDNCDFYDG
jgi:hypothetical protein